jgi:hypothetical protein
VRVLIGGLLHARESPALGAQATCYLRHLKALNLFGHEVSWCFVLDGPHLEYAIDALMLPRVSTITVESDGEHYTRGREPGHDFTPEFSRLAFLRNLLRERALHEDVEALVMIDSDICVPPDLVQRFVAKRVSGREPWVSALVDNGATMNGKLDPDLDRMRGKVPDYSRRTQAFNVMDWVCKEGETPFPVHVKPDFENGGHADIMGAVQFIDIGVLHDARWEATQWGEDIGFAQQWGYRGCYLPVVCDHLMTEARLATHLKQCPLCGGQA